MKRVLSIILMALLPVIAFGQNEFQNGPAIQIIYPQDQDSVSYDRIRISGNTMKDARVVINDHQVKVYPSGAFVDRIDLVPGWNRIKVYGATDAGASLKTIDIYRIPPMQISPAKPTQIDEEYLFPKEDLMLFDGDYLSVRFKGSPGGTAVFSLRRVCKNVVMRELSPEEADGMTGIYHGVCIVRTDEDRSAEPIEIELRGVDGKKAHVETKARVQVLRRLIPLVGELTDETYLRNAISGYSIMSTLPAGTRVHLRERVGSVYKVQLAESHFGWIDAENVLMLPPGTPIPATRISLPAISYDRRWVRLTMPISVRCPFIVEQSIDPAYLELTIFGANLSSQWITYPDHLPEIKDISWSQPSADLFKLKVTLDQKQQWGHRVRYDGSNMILEIKRKPRFAAYPDSPVKGLTFVLDAGHGGEELGAVGSTGLMEKDVNLTYTKKLAVLLKKAGANIVFSRVEDTTMTLRSRMDIAREADADIFCWLHNNSIGGNSNPVAVSGTSTYFTVAQNKELSRTVYDRLVELGLKPFGHVQSTYYVTRQTDMLVVLVEGAFLSHPEDEMLLLSDTFLDGLAKAVFLGLEDFCAEQRKNSN